MTRVNWSWGALLVVACGGGGEGAETSPGTTTGGSSSGDDVADTSTTATDDDSADSTGEPLPPNEPPVATFEATPHSGGPPLEVQLDASMSSDPDGMIVSYEWTFDDGTTDSGVQVSHVFDDGGCHVIGLTVTDDRGDTASADDSVAVVLGAPMSPVEATVDTAPLASAVLPRDVSTDLGTARFSGTLASTGWGEIVAELVADEVVQSSVSVLVCGDAPWPFELDVPVPAELTAYEIRLSAGNGEQREQFFSVPDVVAGDVYIVQGQSNAVSSQFSGDANVNQGAFVRTFASDQWAMAAGNSGGEGGGSGIGQWPIHMAAVLSETHQIPIAVLNAGNGGKPIDFFQRDDMDPTNAATNYGRLLARVLQSNLQDGIRAILWYQGESDGAGYDVHHDGFVALHEDWLEDYAPVERIYVTQIRAGCGGDLIRTQEVQRAFADDYPFMTVMSTTALDGHDGCHYAYAEGYEELGDRYAALLGRDLYGATPATDVDPPNPDSAQFAAGGTQILLTMRSQDSALTWQDGAQADFRLEGSPVTVTGATVEGNVVTLMLSGDGSAATGLTYLGRIGAGQWLTNENGIGLLEFWNLPIAAE